MPVTLTDALRSEYSDLWATCQINPSQQAEAATLAKAVSKNKERYFALGEALGVPWCFVGAAHLMETGLRFDRHLHNGDPLGERTVHVPKDRPRAGSPPFAWEESATDALRIEGLDRVTDWTLPGLLFQLERYNGFGYRTRHPEVLTPYLWSFSNHYSRGKYVSDGTFNPNAVSGQCGAATILRQLAETGAISFDVVGLLSSDQDGSVESSLPLVAYSKTKKSQIAQTLQSALNRIPGIHLRVDGIPGDLTSAAFKRLTGHYLTGDPRQGQGLSGG